MEQCRNKAIRQENDEKNSPKIGTITSTNNPRTTQNTGLEGQIKYGPKG